MGICMTFAIPGHQSRKKQNVTFGVNMTLQNEHFRPKIIMKEE